MVSLRIRSWLAAAGGLAVVGACTGGVLVVQAQGASATPAIRSSQAAAVPSADPSTGSMTISTGSSHLASVYRNGSYTESGRYTTPGGAESILVTLELDNGAVSGVQMRTEAKSPTAKQFQNQFQQRLVSAVVGRDISSLSVSRVAGASLTSIGFNDALTRIKSDAQR